MNFLCVNTHPFRTVILTGCNNAIIAYLDKLISVIGDFDPTCDDVFLPPGITKTSVYEGFRYDYSTTAMDESLLPTDSYFYRVWLRYYTHLKVVKKNHLGICDECAKFDADIAACKNNSTKRVCIHAKKVHIETVMDGISCLY